MKNFKKDIELILLKIRNNASYSVEAGIKDACIAYEKEVANPVEESVEDRKAAFKERMKPYSGMYDVNTLQKFYEYWTAFKTPKSKMMHFEKQKTFSMGMRLRTWKENQDRFLRERHKAAVLGRRQ